MKKLLPLQVLPYLLLGLENKGFNIFFRRTSRSEMMRVERIFRRAKTVHPRTSNKARKGNKKQILFAKSYIFSNNYIEI